MLRWQCTALSILGFMLGSLSRAVCSRRCLVLLPGPVYSFTGGLFHEEAGRHLLHCQTSLVQIGHKGCFCLFLCSIFSCKIEWVWNMQQTCTESLLGVGKLITRTLPKDVISCMDSCSGN